MPSAARSSKRTVSDVLPAGHWLYSFGDLLTLLLCFFVAIISTTYTQQRPPEIVTPQSESDLLKQGLPEERSGIRIAAEERGTEFVLTQDAFVENGSALTATTVERLTETLVAVLSQLQVLEIDVCDQTQESTDATRWFAALQRAEVMHEWFVWRGVPKSQIAVVVRGPHCDVMRAHRQLPEGAVVSGVMKVFHG